MQRIRIAAAASILGLLTLSAHAAVDSPLQRNFAVREGGTLHIDADMGNVHVTTGGSGVAVTVKRHAYNRKALDRSHVTMEQRGNDVYITSRHDRLSDWFSWWGENLDISIDVTIPSRYNAEIGTAGGNVTVGDLHGFVHAHTSGGDMRLGHIDGPVDAHTSGGGVRLESAAGNTLVRTSGGTIVAGDMAGNAELRTSGGSIEIRRALGAVIAKTSGGTITIGEASGAIDAHTSGGSIHARISSQPRADSSLTTSGGNIVVSLAGRIAVDLDAHTSGGGVDSDIPITMQGHIGSESLAGKINGGGPRLLLRSSGGSIHVRRL